MDPSGPEEQQRTGQILFYQVSIGVTFDMYPRGKFQATARQQRVLSVETLRRHRRQPPCGEWALLTYYLPRGPTSAYFAPSFHSTQRPHSAPTAAGGHIRRFQGRGCRQVCWIPFPGLVCKLQNVPAALSASLVRHCPQWPLRGRQSSWGWQG